MPKIANKKNNYDLNEYFIDADGNEYRSRDYLITWMRLAPGTDPSVYTGAGINALSLSRYLPPGTNSQANASFYTNAGPLAGDASMVALGNYTYPSMNFAAANNMTLEHGNMSTASNAPFAFTTLADSVLPVTGDTDLPFTVSMWLKLNGAYSSPLIFSKQDTGVSIQAGINGATGELYFILWDAFNGGSAKIETVSSGPGSIPLNLFVTGWHHVAFTYRGTDPSKGGLSGVAPWKLMNLYIDGMPQTLADASTGVYVGLVRFDADAFQTPGLKGASHEGELAEVAVWSRELAPTEIKAVYNATRTGGYKVISGYLNNPSRTTLRELDDRRGSYPQIGRTTGRPESLASPRAPFDDRNAFDLADPYATATIEFNNLPGGDQSVLLDPTAMAKVGGVRVEVEIEGKSVMVPGVAGTGPFFIVIEDAEGKDGQFEFKTSNNQQLHSSSAAIDVSNIPQGEIRKRVIELRQRIKSAVIPSSKYREIDSQRLRRRALAEFTAKQFAAAVNKQNSLIPTALGAAGIKITAIADGNKVHLRQQVPGAAGNTPIALTVDGSSPPSDFKVLQQFKGGDSSELIYPLGISSQYLPTVKRLGYLVSTPNLVTTASSEQLPTSTEGTRKFPATAITAPGIARHSGPDLTGLFAQSLSPTIEPFVDSRLLLDPNDEFYDHGVDTNQAEGFSSPLGDKVAIVIDLNPVEPTQFGYTTGNDKDAGTNIFAGRPFHPVVYYNFDNQKWEGIRGINNNILDGSSANRVEVTLDEFPIAFSRGVELNADGLKSACRPTTTFGFPFHPKFHATSSMALKLSDYIDAPFVFEKYVLEFSGSYSGGSNYGFINNMFVFDGSKSGDATSNDNVNVQLDNGEAWGGNATTSTALAAFDPQYTNGLPRAAINSFFIMKQTPSCAYDYSYSTAGWISPSGATGKFGESTELSITGSVPGYFGITPGDGNDLTYVDTQRDLVTYGQWVSYAPPPGGNGAYLSQLPFTTMTGALAQGLGRELNVQDTGTTSPYWPGIETSAGLSYRFAQPSPTGSFVLKGKVKRPPALKVTGSFGSAGSFPFWEGTATSLSTARQLYTFNNGTRSGRSQDISDSRSLIKGTAGQVLGRNVNDFSFNLYTTTQPGSFETREVPTHDFDDTSPYVLMPEDQLVFGWQSPLPYGMARACSYPITYGGGTSKYAFNSHAYGALPAAGSGLPGSGPNTTISPGKGRLILYGSLIRENKEVPHSLDQKLTSDSVQEAIGNDPIFDQFDVEYSGQFTNTTSDAIITGSMKVSDNGQGPLGARGVAATFTAGTMGTTGSLKRIVKHADSLERYYDTMVGSPEEFHITNTGKLTTFTEAASGVMLAYDLISFLPAPTTAAVKDYGSDARWLKAFPFEPDYASISRLLNQASLSDTKYNVNQSSGPAADPATAKGVIFDNYWGFDDATGMLNHIGLKPGGAFAAFPSRGDSIPTAINTSDKLVRDFYFGFGNNISGSVDMEIAKSLVDINVLNAGLFNVIPIIRGYKYGLLGVDDIRTDCVFRRDRYGQLRDMLEQRHGGRFFNVGGDVVETGRKFGLNESAVSFLFVNSGSGDPVTPASTESSNLSQFATSSLPYFEGVARNR